MAMPDAPTSGGPRPRIPRPGAGAPPPPEVPDQGDEFLDRLTRDEVADLRNRARRRRWARGAILMHEGERSDWVMVLLSGRAKVSSFSRDGSEVVLAVRGPGALVGELAALDPRPRSATISALEPLEALILPPKEFRAFLQANGRVAFLLLRMLTRRLRDADRKRIEFGTYDTTGRVAQRLVELASRFGEQDDAGVRITLPLSQEELAGWTGASREAVSKALRVLRDRGWIITGRRAITVLDLDSLRHRAR
jgi:CRP/FNR family cyclic AMP-dependent transcriptional regulator